MTLKQKIKNEPYFKINNCKDVNDINYALAECRKLLSEYGSKPNLCMILSRLTKKKQKLDEKEYTSNMHPIYKSRRKNERFISWTTLEQHLKMYQDSSKFVLQ